jgi:hypothetical protein
MRASQKPALTAICGRYAENITSPDPLPEAQPRVALLVDYPALLRAVRATDPEAVPRLPDLVRRATVMGPIHVARAYGAWYDVEEASASFSAGLDPVFVPPVGPGSAPTVSSLVADGLSLIRSGQAEALALSGDDRLFPLIAIARSEQLPVALIAHSCLPDGPCLKLVDFAEPASAFARGMTRAERYRRPASVA